MKEMSWNGMGNNEKQNRVQVLLNFVKVMPGVWS